MELQQGVVGDTSTFPALAAVVRERGVLAQTSRLLDVARSREVPVVHCTAGFRADRRGSPLSAPLISAALRKPDHMVIGTKAVELMPEVGPAPSDLISERSHGVSPFSGTNLDATLRAFDVATVIAVGVSLNLAIPGLAMEAVNLGYRVVIPSDAVAGVPVDYAEALIKNTLSLVATITTVDDLIQVL